MSPVSIASDLLIEGRYALSMAISGIWSQVVRQGLPAVQSGCHPLLGARPLFRICQGDGGRAEPKSRSARGAITHFFNGF
jgi:hypothetical protein